MTLPKIEWKINFGHVLSLLILLAGFIAGYTKLQVQHEALAMEVQRHEADDKKMWETFALKETRKFRDDTVDSKFEAVMNGINDLKDRMKRIEEMHMKQAMR